jgi:PRTRC genetic system protein E
MFQQLAQMLGEGDGLVITVVALKEGRLALTVVPKGEFKNKDLGSGLSLEATPEEFDADLVEHLSAYVNQRKSLKEQIEAQTLVLAEAEKASKSATASAISKATTGKGANTAKKVAVEKREGGTEGKAERGDGLDDDNSAGGGEESCGSGGGVEPGAQPVGSAAGISLF